MGDRKTGQRRPAAMTEAAPKMTKHTPTEKPGGGQPRAWQRMLSGRRLDLLAPQPEDIEIEDIAHGLARVARWNGQTIGEHAFSVAQHAIVVEDIFTAYSLRQHEPAASGGRSSPVLGNDEASPRQMNRWRLAALLHDAPEYVIGDMISPFKAALGLDYKTFEQRLQVAIHARFQLPATLPRTVAAAIKEADRVSAYFEALGLAGFAQDEADRYFGRPTALPSAVQEQLMALRPWPASIAQQAFLDRFGGLAV